jgi:hypothetical protein
LMTNETVVLDTFARRAISSIVGITLLYLTGAAAPPSAGP